jgi:glycosyltransferase involved in cell wall biosynthesis
MGPLAFLVPGRLETRTGGYIYDRRIIDGLRGIGWPVTVHELDDSFPHPTSSALDHAARVLAATPDEGICVVDGLAFGAMPEEAERESARLRLVALVHHPLAAETGLSPDVAARLETSETHALAHARLVIVTSKATAAALANYGVGPDRIAVVEPGTDRAPVARGSKASLSVGHHFSGANFSSADDLHLLCVGTLTPRKGHDTLFRALATLRDLRWHLTCVGSLDRDPAMVERLRGELRTHRLEDRVSLVGEADEGAMAAFYDAADLFVLPSEYEGYGMAVAEALARGLPVISTPTGAIAEIVTGGAGVLVPPGDAPALANALARAIGDPGYRAQLSSAAVLVRDRLPSWNVAALRMGAALERLGQIGDERVQR